MVILTIMGWGVAKVYTMSATVSLFPLAYAATQVLP